MPLVFGDEGAELSSGLCLPLFRGHRRAKELVRINKERHIAVSMECAQRLRRLVRRDLEQLGYKTESHNDHSPR
jgi:hypothetical protein